LKAQASPFRTPKDPGTFPLLNKAFWGPREGTIIAVLDPWQADAVMGWASVEPRLWQYFSRV